MACQFLCAQRPEKRPEWALRMSQLLSRNPGAALICLEYPLYKPPLAGGPPFGLSSEMYEQHLSRPGKVLDYDTEGHVLAEIDGAGNPIRDDNGLVRVMHYVPARTHAVGKEKDWISVWKRPPIE